MFFARKNTIMVPSLNRIGFLALFTVNKSIILTLKKDTCSVDEAKSFLDSSVKTAAQRFDIKDAPLIKT